MTKIFVTGASGLLGSKITDRCREGDFEVVPTFHEHSLRQLNAMQLDLQDSQQVRDVILSMRPDYIVHCAALTDVEKCESNRDLAWRINVEGTENIVDACEDAGASLIYVSTDYVFRGDEGDYQEEDETCPINHYGYTKLQAESLVRGMRGDWVIARPSVIYGSSPAAGKGNFALWVINSLREGGSIKVITDQWVSPTLNTNLAEMILEIIRRGLTGVYHLGGATPLSRYDFAKKIAKEFSFDGERIQPALTVDMNWVAKRPVNSSLCVQKAFKTLNAKPMRIEEALSQLRKEMKSEVIEE